MAKRREKGGKNKCNIATRTKARENTVESKRQKSSSNDRVDKPTKKRKEEHKHGRNKQVSDEKDICSKINSLLLCVGLQESAWINA